MSEKAGKNELSMIIKPAGWKKEVVRGYIRLVRFADNAITRKFKINDRIAEVMAASSKTGRLTLRVLKFNLKEESPLFPNFLEIHVSHCVPHRGRLL